VTRASLVDQLTHRLEFFESIDSKAYVPVRFNEQCTMNTPLWYLFRTMTTRETATAALLRNRGFVPFLPVVHKEVKLRRWKGDPKTEMRDFALYPGYIFVAHDGRGDWWTRLLAMRPIFGPICLEGRPWPVPLAEIERLSNLSGNVTMLPKGPALAPGVRVRITDGIYQGRTVEIQSIKNDRAKLPLSIFGAERLVEVSVQHLEAA